MSDLSNWKFYRELETTLNEYYFSQHKIETSNTLDVEESFALGTKTYCSRIIVESENGTIRNERSNDSCNQKS